MTGPGPGKIKIPSKVVFCNKKGCRELDVVVYLHLKGLSRARVTHIDLEGDKIEDLFCSDTYVRVSVSGGLMRIYPTRGTQEDMFELRIISDVFRKIFKEGKILSWGFLGKKEGGIYIGFKKDVLESLERYGFKILKEQ
ncbi:MAG: hypothetical protein DRJ35_03930 [Thermoprotei archaeon]|nr:MAG: hypothetical protein DRJ35_03930 [Thermoprotei archaeon]